MPDAVRNANQREFLYATRTNNRFNCNRHTPSDTYKTPLILLCHDLRSSAKPARWLRVRQEQRQEHPHDVPSVAASSAAPSATKQPRVPRRSRTLSTWTHILWICTRLPRAKTVNLIIRRSTLSSASCSPSSTHSPSTLWRRCTFPSATTRMRRWVPS